MKTLRRSKKGNAGERVLQLMNNGDLKTAYHNNAMTLKAFYFLLFVKSLAWFHIDLKQ